MATTTRVLTASVNGTVYTSNLNGALEAIDTCHAGATAPTDEVSNGKFWLDTSVSPSVLKVRANGAWVVVGTGQSLTTSTDLAVNSIRTIGGSAASPSHTFSGDQDTGMFSTGANGLGFSAGGVQRMAIVSNGDLNLPAVSTETKQVNIGTGRSGDGSSLIDFISDGATYTTYGLRILRNSGANGSTQIDHRGTGDLLLSTNEAAAMIFQTDSTTRLSIGSGGDTTVSGTLLPSSDVRANAGTAAAPAYGFLGDGDTGMFSASANRLSFSCAGAEVLRLENDQIMHQNNGSAAAPSFSFRGDPDTGMYRYGANSIGFSAGGSERFRITPTEVKVEGDLVLNGTNVLDNVIGVGQQWYNDGSIVSGTAYTNSYGRPIQLMISFNGAGNKTVGLSHNGTTWVETLNLDNDGSDSDVNASFIVPAGHRWRVVGGWTFSRRLTLR